MYAAPFVNVHTLDEWVHPFDSVVMQPLHEGVEIAATLEAEKLVTTASVVL